MRAKFIIGVDEVGRGPLAGSVTVCALALKRRKGVRLLNQFLMYDRAGRIKDSKRMSEEERIRCFRAIKDFTRRSALLTFAVSHVSSTVIDRCGIVSAVHLALTRALRKLSIDPLSAHVLLDGSLHAPHTYKNQRTVVKGDQTVPVIALASVIAKVHRDQKMKRLARLYPEYGFETHVGYGTRLHLEAVSKFGLSKIHRVSFFKSMIGVSQKS